MASKSLGTLTVDVIAKVGGFIKGMTSAERAAAQSSRKIAMEKKKMAQQLDRIYAGIGSMGAKAFSSLASGATLAAAAIAAGLVASIKQGVEFADQIDEASKRMQVSAEELTRLTYAASMYGVTLEDLSTSYAKLSQFMVRADKDGSKQQQLFEALGISLVDQDGSMKSQLELFKEIADAVRAIEDPALSTALAMEIFGRSGLKFMEMLEGGSEAMDSFSARADQLGITLSTSTAEAAAEFNDRLSEAQQIVTSMGARIAEGLLPYVNQAIERFAAWASDADNLATMTNIAQGAIDLLSTAIDWLISLFSDGQSKAEDFKNSVDGISTSSNEAANAVGNLSQRQSEAADTSSYLGDKLGGIGTLISMAVVSFRGLDETISAVINTAFGLVDVLRSIGNLMMMDMSGFVGRLISANESMRVATEQGWSAVRRIGQFWNVAGGGKDSGGGSKPSQSRGALPSMNSALNGGGPSMSINEVLGAPQNRDVAAYIAGNRALVDAQGERKKINESQVRGILAGEKDKKKKGGGGGKKSDEEREAEKLEDAYQRLIAAHGERMAAIGKEGNLAQLMYKLEHGELKKLTQAKKDELIANEKAYEAAMKHQESLDLFKDMNKEHERRMFLLQHEGEMGELLFEIQHGNLKALSDEQKEQLRTQQATYDAEKKLYEERKKEEERRKRDLEFAKDNIKDMEHAMLLLGKTADEQERLNLLRDLGTAATTEWGEKNLEVLEQLQQQTKVINQQIEVMDTVRSSFSGALKDWVSGTKSFKDAFLGALDSIIDKILGMISDNLIEQLLGGFGTTQTGTKGGGISNFFGMLFGGGGGGGGWGFAGGGNAMAHSVTRVNEKGPELLSVNGKDYLMMGQHSGTVTPNHMLGKGGGFSQVNNFTVQGRVDRRTQEQLAMQVAQRSQLAESRNR